MISKSTAVLSCNTPPCRVLAGFRETEENRLVKAASSGDSSAFTALSQRHSQQLMRSTYAITRNYEDAEDAVQDALMRAFVNIAHFRGNSSFATWLTRIAINSALMIRRKQRSVAKFVPCSKEDFPASRPFPEIADRAPNPERLFVEQEETNILNKAVAKLRPSLREIVEIQRFQERSVQEVAALAGLTVPAVKSRMYHAKAALRMSLTRKVPHQRRRAAGVRMLPAA
jgi:RNA polymerase sigma-70 factor, ECF subfamily